MHAAAKHRRMTCKRLEARSNYLRNTTPLEG